MVPAGEQHAQGFGKSIDPLDDVLAMLKRPIGHPGRQVGERFGVTRERIRQLQNRALEKMRDALADMENPEAVALKRLVDDVRERDHDHEEESMWESASLPAA